MSYVYEKTRGLYRSRHGFIFGVCKGFADRFNLSTFWVRTLFVIGLLFTGFFPLGVLYIVAALVIKLEPRANTDIELTYHTGTCRRERTKARMRTTMDSLDERLRKMEDVVTDRARDWEQRLYNS